MSEVLEAEAGGSQVEDQLRPCLTMRNEMGRRHSSVGECSPSVGTRIQFQSRETKLRQIQYILVRIWRKKVPACWWGCK